MTQIIYMYVLLLPFNFKTFIHSKVVFFLLYFGRTVFISFSTPMSVQYAYVYIKRGFSF